jgi:hypothetical protein
MGDCMCTGKAFHSRTGEGSYKGKHTNKKGPLVAALFGL